MVRYSSFISKCVAQPHEQTLLYEEQGSGGLRGGCSRYSQVSNIPVIHVRLSETPHYMIYESHYTKCHTPNYESMTRMIYSYEYVCRKGTPQHRTNILVCLCDNFVTSKNNSIASIYHIILQKIIPLLVFIIL